SLDEDDVKPCGIENARDISGASREPAQISARRHRADEDPFIEEMLLHANAVAEDGASRKRTCRIDRDHSDPHPFFTDGGNERSDKRALSGSGRTGDSDRIGPPSVRVEAL